MISSTVSGLKAETTAPLHGAYNISVYNDIKITFNSDLNTATIVNGFVILKDANNAYRDISTVTNHPDLFASVDGNVSYKDRVITFKPASPLEKATKYLICIKAGGIKDITGLTIQQDIVYYFVTEGMEVDGRTEILSPSFGDIMQEINSIEWADIEAKAYVLEISKQPTFEVLTYSKVITTDAFNPTKAPTNYTPDCILEDGLYYVRVRSLVGPWSESVQFFIKRVQNAITSDNDIAEIIQQIDDIRELELLEVFPEDNASNIPLNTKLVYLKFSGRVSLTDIDFSNTYIECTDESDNSTELKGIWHSVYDETYDCTYMIYNIEK